MMGFEINGTLGLRNKLIKYRLISFGFTWLC